MVSETVRKVTPKARKGRFRGVAAVAAQLGLSKGHVWQVLAGNRKGGTAERIRSFYCAWCEANPEPTDQEGGQ